MRKLVLVAVALMLVSVLLVPAVASAATDYSYVKVKLSSMGNPSSVQFKSAGAYRVAEDSGVDIFPGILYTVKAEGTGIKLSYNNGAGVKEHTLPSKITLVQYTNGTSKNFLYVNNPANGWRYYSGNMTFLHTSGTTYLQLVNTLFIETYLYGVVAYEMGDNWPAEALKAQAVCARTYAMAHIKANPSATWHLVDTSADQVYRGYPYDSSGAPMQNVINAVDATRGKAIVTGDPALLDFMSGQYSASNGGQIRSTATNDVYDVRNPISPYFTYIFPKATDAATMNSLSSEDRAKANTMLALLKKKLPQALKDQYNLTCGENDVTINGVVSAVPAQLRTGMPDGSREFTKVAVTVNVSVGGVPPPAPVALVEGNNAVILNGDNAPSEDDDTDFGTVNVTGQAVEKTYTLSNTGYLPLTVTGITITGASAGDFTLKTPVPATIAAGASAVFKVAFDPAVAGLRAATVNIASNDAKSPYTFAIQGTGGGLSGQCNLTDFWFEGYPDAHGVINADAIQVNLPAGTDLTGLVAVFTNPAGSTVKVGAVEQVSGDTANNFSSPLAYVVTAENGTTHVYTVTVTAGSGGGGMPAGFTGSVVVLLDYVSQAADGDWDKFGEMRTEFSTYASLLDASRYWLLYEGAKYDGKCLTVVARGYGHGRGMSQRGAQQMANETKPGTTSKFNYQDIVNFYFSSGSLATVGITQKALTQISGKGATATWKKVNATTLNVRTAADPKGTVLVTLPKNTIVEVLSTSGSWSRILRGSTGLVGYVSSQYLTASGPPPSTPPAPSASATPSPGVSPTPTAGPTGTPTPLMGRVLSATLNMRSQTNTASTIVYTLEKYDNVLILDANVAANWYKVRYLDRTGYCMYQSGATVYIELIGSATQAPAATGTGTPVPGGFSVPAVTAKANISSGTLYIRKTASATAEKVGEIPPNGSFTIKQVATSREWLFIKYGDKEGYVKAAYALIGGNTSYKACTVTILQLNVRSGAGTNFGIIGTLKSNETVVVIAKLNASSGTWYKIQLGGGVIGYIDARYARISSP